MPQSVSDAARKALPQILTASRLLLGAAALIAALDGGPYRAATLISLGSVTDGLDGFLARRLRVTSPFGALFDYFADYMCYVVAPWAVVRALLGPQLTAWEESAILLPLLTAAIRYARNGLIVADPAQEGREVPGLGTVFFAFVCVAAVFLDAEALLGISTLHMILPAFIVIFSLLMIAPIRYPKMAKFAGMSPVVLVLLALMPFFATRMLAGAMFVLGVLYAVLAPLFADRGPVHARAHQVR